MMIKTDTIEVSQCKYGFFVTITRTRVVIVYASLFLLVNKKLHFAGMVRVKCSHS